ncbi:metallophosphoesterase family protein [Chloroflexota bacterium]
MKIVQISDLHISGLNFVPEWAENVLSIIDSVKPDVVLITGDLTDDGYAYEYDIVRKYIDRIEAENVILVPGNHDARNEGYKLFEEIFQTRFPIYADNKVMILGIDSTEPDIDDGRIGRGSYAYIRERLSPAKEIKILAMHHHLIPIPATGRERNIPVDAGDVLKLCIELGVDIVFSGHKHMPWIWKLEDTYFITAGTSTSRRLKGTYHPSFYILEIEEDKVLLKEANSTDKKLRDVLRLDEITTKR